MAGWTKMPIGMEAGLGPGNFVFDGDPATPRKRAHPPPPNFGGRLLWPDGWIDQDATCTEVNVGPGDIVLDGVAPIPKRGTAPPASVHVYCGQTAGWMKTPLGTEVDVGPGHIVLDGVPALQEMGTAAPVFLSHVYCGHGRPSQLLLSSSKNGRPRTHEIWLIHRCRP